MHIKWLGHSCFLFVSEGGLRIITDPFNNQVGYNMPQEKADIVTISHNHMDHNYSQAIKGSFESINRPGVYSVKGAEILGIPTFHDSEGGRVRGDNVVFKFTIDGLTLCHCGDLGHLFSPEQLKELGHIDILLLPVGGVFTIDAKEAAQVVEQIKPKITIPMHFKTETVAFPLDPIDDFVEAVGITKNLLDQTLEVDKKNIEEKKGIIVLNYE